jgi:hypothetical protein
VGIGSFLKKGTGMDYLDGENEPKKGGSSKQKSPTSNKQDEKFLKYLEQNLKRVNNEVEDMLEKVRIRRGL